MKLSRTKLRRLILKEIKNLQEVNDEDPTNIGDDYGDYQNVKKYDRF